MDEKEARDSIVTLFEKVAALDNHRASHEATSVSRWDQQHRWNQEMKDCMKDHKARVAELEKTIIKYTSIASFCAVVIGMILSAVLKHFL